MSQPITNQISIYKNLYKNLDSSETIPLDIFLENIRAGYWQDIVLPIRAIAEKKARDAAKQKAPYVTIAGIFSERNDGGLIQHSGYIGIDIDGIEGEDLNDIKQILCADPYVVACFVSISGRGLCCLFRIDPAKHRQAHEGIGEYMMQRYNIAIDPTSVNLSRARFVSYDPYIYIADRPEKFAQYPKEKPPKKIEKVVFDKSDFEQVLKKIVEGGINITEDSYYTWVRICFALVDKFGEAGREYFHIISAQSGKCRNCAIDKQYNACLKHRPGTKVATIATFYYYCKLAGIEVYSQRTKTIIQTTASGKKGGLNVKQIAETLHKFEGITDAEEIIKQAYDSDIEAGGESLLEELEMWLRQNYTLERNEVTRYIENNGTALAQKDLNSIFVKAKKIFDKVNYELLDRLINSDFVPGYNPLKRYFINADADKLKHVRFKDCVTIQDTIQLLKKECRLITALANTIRTPDADYCLYFCAKWLSGCISSVYGQHSPLMFVLSGAEQNTGKTEWFRNLLPASLHTIDRTYPDYYAESKLDAGKDDEILMTQKLIIMDDEMGGKSKKEVKRLKELTSKQTFSLREPYGRNNVDLQRIAVLCGTTNENEILSDPTGNRRIIPIPVNSINHELYNRIDKDLLWYEIYALYHSGFRWRLNKPDIIYLGTNEAEFTTSSSENELLHKYFERGETYFTATDIKVVLEKHSQQKLSLDRIGKELKRAGFEQKIIKSGAGTKRVYLAKIAQDFANPVQENYF